LGTGHTVKIQLNMRNTRFDSKRKGLTKEMEGEKNGRSREMKRARSDGEPGTNSWGNGSPCINRLKGKNEALRWKGICIGDEGACLEWRVTVTGTYRAEPERYGKRGVVWARSLRLERESCKRGVTGGVKVVWKIPQFKTRGP